MLTSYQIKTMRDNLEMSQEEMARALGVSTRTVSRWEVGTASPTSTSLKKFGQFLYQRVREALPPNVLSDFYDLRRSAARITTQAIQRGELPKLVGIGRQKVSCTDCGKTAAHYDHRDYTKPYLVEPVCQSCNFLRGFAILTLQHIWKTKKRT
jgi:DNA-binding XRE family transcriptional regulator